MNSNSIDENIPLVVDLDGTLINTDLLHEGFILLIRKNFFYVFESIVWLFKGKAYFKNKIFSHIIIHPELLPYNVELLDFLKEERNKGRKLILATASLQFSATEICKVHPIFDEIHGTESINLKGKNKLNLLIELFGKSKFDYIGNSNSDLVIFASSRYAYLVNPKRSLERKTRKTSNLKHTWNSGKGSIRSYLKGIRAYQWVKNFLIFVPLITSHSFHSFNLFVNTTLAFLTFSFVASSGYLLNDLLDLESDRAHLRKKFRPLASGKLSIPSGFFLAITLLTVGLVIAANLDLLFLIVVTLYFLLSFSYSVYLKKIALYDVFILALLYSIRVFAGAIVINVTLSFWLIAFSTFIFLSLALVKRYSELIMIKNEPNLRNKRREYSVEDLNLLQIMGIVSGFLSVIVFSLYIDSPEVALLYSKPKILWAMSLLFLFWISRIWHKTIHGKMTDDPIIFAIKDITSYCIFFLIGVILFISI